jgi:hypothetical protein
MEDKFERSSNRSKTMKRETILKVVKYDDIAVEEDIEQEGIVNKFIRSGVKAKTSKRVTIIPTEDLKKVDKDEPVDESKKKAMSSKSIISIGVTDHVVEKIKTIGSVHYLSQTGIGEDGLFKINQDCYLVNENLFGISNFNIYGVLDGHGKCFSC